MGLNLTNKYGSNYNLGAKVLKNNQCCSSTLCLPFKSSHNPDDFYTNVVEPMLSNPNPYIMPRFIPIVSHDGVSHYYIETSGNKERDIAKVKNRQGDVVIESSKKKGYDGVTIRFKDGKPGLNAMVEIHNKDTKESLVALMKQGEIITDDFEVRFLPHVSHRSKPVQFNGLHILTAHKKDASERAVNNFDFSNFKSEFKPELAEEFEALVGAGGFGTRAKNITEIHTIDEASGKIIDTNKPGIQFPARNFHLIHSALYGFSQAGLLSHDTKPVFVHDEKKTGLARGILNGLREDKIPNNKPVILYSGDSFSDVNLTEVIEDFKRKKADIMVVGYPVPADKVGSFGIMATDDDMHIKGFIEKPETLIKAAPGKIKNDTNLTDHYLGNISIYIFSPEALKALDTIEKDFQNKHDPDKFNTIDEAYDVGRDFMPAVVNKVRDGQSDLKIYAHTAKNCRWADIGNLGELLRASRDTAEGKYRHPKDIKEQIEKNVDLETGVVCIPNGPQEPSTKEIFNKFLKANNGHANGDILVLKAPGLEYALDKLYPQQ